MQKSSVIFRDIEPRDAQTVYTYKNDASLNAMIVNQREHFTMQDAQNWVEGCIHHTESYRFWAIATNDASQDMVGWISIANIDYVNQSVNLHGILIGNPLYRDGITWIEAYLFIFHYVFETMRFHRLWGTKRVDHKQSMAISNALFFHEDGVLRHAKKQGDVFVDLSLGAILRDEYLQHIQNQDYEIAAIVKRIVAYSRQRKKQGR